MANAALGMSVAHDELKRTLPTKPSHRRLLDNSTRKPDVGQPVGPCSTGPVNRSRALPNVDAWFSRRGRKHRILFMDEPSTPRAGRLDLEGAIGLFVHGTTMVKTIAAVMRTMSKEKMPPPTRSGLSRSPVQRIILL